MLAGSKVSSPGDLPSLGAGHHKDRHPWNPSMPIGHLGTEFEPSLTFTGCDNLGVSCFLCLPFLPVKWGQKQY